MVELTMPPIIGAAIRFMTSACAGGPHDREHPLMIAATVIILEPARWCI
jgi:hypothetical protein